eukprot:scaffold3931_cov112-Isochrysis_galbana.AAC.2
MEDDTNPEPGSKRVRPSSADKSSTQVRLRARASACGTPWLSNRSSSKVEVEHELKKPKRDEPAACTVASISSTTG